MKAFISATKLFFKQIWLDFMLSALIFIPVFMGLLFRFGVPALEAFLCARLGRAAILLPYYPVFDLLLSVLTPLMSTAAGAMVILDEADAGLSRALSATPLKRTGYLASRIGVPALLSTAYCVVITAVFNLSGLSALKIALLSLCSGALGVTASLMISALAKNKVEGLASPSCRVSLSPDFPPRCSCPRPQGFSRARSRPFG